MRVYPISIFRNIAMWVLCAPFLFWALVPQGVMPSQAGSGPFAGLTMVLCAEDGVIQVALDPVTLEPVDEAPPSHDRRCAWAAAQLALDLASPPVIPAYERPLRPAPVTAVPLLTLARAQATGLPPATGPPAV